MCGSDPYVSVYLSLSAHICINTTQRHPAGRHTAGGRHVLGVQTQGRLPTADPPHPPYTHTTPTQHPQCTRIHPSIHVCVSVHTCRRPSPSLVGKRSSGRRKKAYVRHLAMHTTPAHTRVYVCPPVLCVHPPPPQASGSSTSICLRATRSKSDTHTHTHTHTEERERETRNT